MERNPFEIVKYHKPIRVLYILRLEVAIDGNNGWNFAPYYALLSLSVECLDGCLDVKLELLLQLLS